MTFNKGSVFELSTDGRRAVIVKRDLCVLEWLAGLLEGEGSFVCGPPSKPNYPRIALHMTDLDVVKKVSTLFGVKFFTNRPSAPHHKAIYSCGLTGIKAVALMKELRPLMSSRRQSQIAKSLSSYKPVRDPDTIYPTREQILEHHEWSHAEIARHYGVSLSYVDKLLAKGFQDTSLSIKAALMRDAGRRCLGNRKTARIEGQLLEFGGSASRQPTTRIRAPLAHLLGDQLAARSAHADRARKLFVTLRTTRRSQRVASGSRRAVL